MTSDSEKKTSGEPSGLVSRLALVLVLLAGPAACNKEQPADLVFRGGEIYTVDANRSWASAVGIKDGRIIYVGDDERVGTHIGLSTRVVDLSGRMMLPGFHDSHMHPMSGGFSRLLNCRLFDLEWPNEVHAALRECANGLEDGEWLLAIGLDPSVFDGPGPRRTALDELVPDRPAYVSTDRGILAWANTRTLVAAGIDANTPDPPNGMIERDLETGEPAGTLRGSAVNLVRQRFPTPPTDKYREALQQSTAMANRFGITSLIDASVNEAMFEAYCEADVAGEMTVRVVASQLIEYGHGVEKVDEFVMRNQRICGDRMRADSAKIFVDGQIDQHTAALLKPYSDAPNTQGQPYFEPEILNAIVARLDAEDFQVHMHVIGDRAIRIGLDAIEKAIEANGPRDRRHQLAHIQFWNPADISRVERLGVVADFQPLWAYADPEVADLVESALGPERSRWLVPMASVADSGAIIVAGSDWPSPSMNPLLAMQIAITRRPPDGSAPAWIPEERVELAQMIEAYTIAGAWLAREESINGSIEVGKAADLIVLERNLFEVDPMVLKDVRVLLTLLEGATVYRDSEFTWPADGQQFEPLH